MLSTSRVRLAIRTRAHQPMKTNSRLLSRMGEIAKREQLFSDENTQTRATWSASTRAPLGPIHNTSDTGTAVRSKKRLQTCCGANGRRHWGHFRSHRSRLRNERKRVVPMSVSGSLGIRKSPGNTERTRFYEQHDHKAANTSLRRAAQGSMSTPPG